MQLGGFEVNIRRKRVKNLNVYIKPPDGRVEITAPLHMSEQAIAAFLRSRADWIDKKQATFRQRPPQASRFENGEVLYVWGQPYTLTVAVGRAGLVLTGDGAVLTAPEGADTAAREHIVREWYRTQLHAAVTERLPVWEQTTGLHAADFRIRLMSSRFGSCNTVTRRITVNLLLAQKPPACLDYLLLHELAHLVERGHGPRFAAVLDRYMPDWRDRRRELNRP